jgi:GAF domain-containing protein
MRKFQKIDFLNKALQRIWSKRDLKKILEESAELILEFSQADAFLTFLLNENGEFELKFSHPQISEEDERWKKREFVEWLSKLKEPFFIESVCEDPCLEPLCSIYKKRFESLFALPLLIGKKLLGVVVLFHEKTRKYTEEELSLIQNITYQMGGALLNLRLAEEIKRKDFQLETLSKISATVVSDKYLEEILQLIVALTAQMLNSKICSLMLLDEKKESLIIKATQSLSEVYKNKPPVKVGESVSGRVIKEKKPIMVYDVTKDELYAYPEVAREEGLKSLLSVPMSFKSEVIGVINIYTSYPHHFTPEEVRIAQAVANQAAVAIENVKLWREAEKAKEALETRKLVERAKGILMEKLNLSEREAHRKLQKISMEKGVPIKKLAESIILSSELGSI